MLAKQARAEAVKGRDPGLAVLILQSLVDAPRDLGGGARRKRENEDLSTAGHAFAHRLLIQVGQGMRFAGARPGQHAQWSVDFVEVEWQMGFLGWRGRPDYAGPRVLKSAVPVK
jgi:hypothetical protein